MDKDISELRNLGPKSAAWLSEIGITTLEELRSVGSVEVYSRLRNSGFPASLNLVYAIEGALIGLDWRELPASTKAELRREVKAL